MVFDSSYYRKIGFNQSQKQEPLKAVGEISLTEIKFSSQKILFIILLEHMQEDIKKRGIVRNSLKYNWKRC